MITDAKPGKITFLGRLGEHLTRKIRFYDGDVLRDYPGAEISVLNQRPGDADSYPVPSAYIEQDGDYLYWTIQSGDLAADGFGQCEMRATVDGKVALSVVYATEIGKSLAGGDEPPEPWEGYVGQVIDAADRAEAAAQLLENPGAEAVTLEPGAQATAGYEDGTFTFGIPAGAPGQDGEPGEDGYSPSVSVSKTGGTATITITDKSGTTTAEITDGQPGEPGDDGYSPSASVSKSGGTATITITDKNGTTTADVKDGADGQDGAPGQDGQDGYTPVRGTDYWTAADQAQIVEDVQDTLIDDTAGAGDVTKVWSASKSAGEVSSLKSAIDAEIEGITPTPFIDWPQTEIDSGAQQRRTMYFVRNRIRQVHSASGASTSFRYFGMCKGKIVVADSVDAMDGVLSQITESDLMTLPETAGRYRIRLTGRIASDGGDTVNFPTFYLIYLDGSALAYTQIDSIPASGVSYAFAYDIDGFSGRKFALGVRSKNAVAEFTAYVNFIPVNADAGVVTVTGSTPAIVGESGKRYVCGTVDSISITPPSVGIVDIVFSSGTTPTVLTASGVTWPSWFDSTSLNASTVYDITIKDGYGVVNTWT